MFNKLKIKSEFSRNVLTLMTGTTIAQAIPIAISPILTRLYSPKDFGIYALFISVASIFGTIANGRYELAIMLPKKDEDAINIFALGFIITCCLSLLLLIGVVIFNDYLVFLLQNKEIGIWLYFIPITVFFMGLFNLLNYYNSRIKNYTDIANSTIIKSIILASVQLIIGFIKQGATGLITGQILSQMGANIKLLKNILNDKLLLSSVSKINILKMAKDYKEFPKFSMFAIMANSLSYNLLNILIPLFYNISTLGFYSLVQKVLGMPSILIGNSIGQVFFQEAARERLQFNGASKVFYSTLKKLILIGLPFYLLLFLIVEVLFEFVFGNEWAIAGRYAKILIPLFFVRFIVKPFTFLQIVFKQVSIDLFFQLGILVLIISIIFMVDYLGYDFYQFLLIYTIVLSFYYVLYLTYCYSKFIKKGH